MRVLWISDSPDTPSGFGNVTRAVCAGLARRGHTVSILGWQTTEQHEWNGCTVYAASGMLGSRSLFPFLIRHRPEIVIALADVWWLPYFSAPHIRRQMLLTDTPWALYFPIDGDKEGGGLPPSWIELLRDVDIPIAMSEFGRETAHRSGIECTYIPHGVDRSVFFPPEDREQAKAAVDATGKFLVLSDSRNQPRKLLPRLLDVFARFVKGRPDALLHLHTDPDDEFTKSGIYSYDVRADARHLGIESQIRFTPGHVMKQGGGVPLDRLAAYYRAADVHVLASSGEGFGLPTLQAAAAGAVPVAGAYSASLELVKGHGEAIEIADWSENEFGIRRALIDVDDAAAKLARLYNDRALLKEKSRRSADFAGAYDWDRVLDKWDELLVNLAIRRRRITRIPVTQALNATLSARFAPEVPTGSVTVNVVEHKFGRLEAGIIADTKGHLSDVRVPSVQDSCTVGGLRILRTAGYVCVSPGDYDLFRRLQAIFPMISGWIPTLSGGNTAPKHRLNNDLTEIPVDSPQRARYDLAQSILLLNVSGELTDEYVVDAALFAVPCIGPPRSEAQQALWAELTRADEEHALNLGRELLTNCALMRRIASMGHARCVAQYHPDETEVARCVRESYAVRSPVVSAWR
jgi:glycosyltransferase involved in cell wall biosynthesis